MFPEGTVFKVFNDSDPGMRRARTQASLVGNFRAPWPQVDFCRQRASERTRELLDLRDAEFFRQLGDFRMFLSPISQIREIWHPSGANDVAGFRKRDKPELYRRWGNHTGHGWNRGCFGDLKWCCHIVPLSFVL